MACNFICGYPPEVEPPDDYAPILPYLLLPALAAGIVTLLLTALFALTLPPVPTALLGTLAIAIFWLAISRGQNLVAFGKLAQSLEAALVADHPDDDTPDDLYRHLSLFLLLLLKLACLANLLYLNAWNWLFLVPVLSVLSAMEMSVHLRYFSQTPALLIRPRALALLGFLVLSLICGLKGLLVVAFIWLLCHAIGTWGREHAPRLRDSLISGTSEFVEVLVLLLGVILLN